MLGASQEQQDDVFAAARQVGGYFELLERASQLVPIADKPIFEIDPETKMVKLVSQAD